MCSKCQGEWADKRIWADHQRLCGKTIDPPRRPPSATTHNHNITLQMPPAAPSAPPTQAPWNAAQEDAAAKRILSAQQPTHALLERALDFLGNALHGSSPAVSVSAPAHDARVCPLSPEREYHSIVSKYPSLDGLTWLDLGQCDDEDFNEWLAGAVGKVRVGEKIALKRLRTVARTQAE